MQTTLLCVYIFSQTQTLTQTRQVMSESGGHVVVLAATNDIERLDPALLRPGRLDRRVHLDLPDAAARTAIFLQRLLNMPLQMEGGGRGVVEGEGHGKGECGGGNAGRDAADAAAAGVGAVDVTAPTTMESIGNNNNPDSTLSWEPTRRSRSTPLQPMAQPQTQSQEMHPPPWPRRRRQGLLDSTEAYAKWLAGETEGSSGAHVIGVCREAALAALREGIGATEVAPRHFDAVLDSQGGRAAVAVGGGSGRR